MSDSGLVFPISIRKRDHDLQKVFSVYAAERGDRSELARQLMRDGIRYRLEHGIPIGMRNVELVELSAIEHVGTKPSTEAAQKTIVYKDATEENDVKGVKEEDKQVAADDPVSSGASDEVVEEVSDEELDALLENSLMNRSSNLNTL